MQVAPTLARLRARNVVDTTQLLSAVGPAELGPISARPPKSVVAPKSKPKQRSLARTSCATTPNMLLPGKMQVPGVQRFGAIRGGRARSAWAGRSWSTPCARRSRWLRRRRRAAPVGCVSGGVLQRPSIQGVASRRPIGKFPRALGDRGASGWRVVCACACGSGMGGSCDRAGGGGGGDGGVGTGGCRSPWGGHGAWGCRSPCDGRTPHEMAAAHGVAAARRAWQVAAATHGMATARGWAAAHRVAAVCGAAATHGPMRWPRPSK